MAHNKELPWSPAVGFFPAEFLAGAFPVLPRFRLSFDCLLQCSFSAFFNQPIIPVGHHEEVRDGLELLATVANHINSFGDVHWLDLQGISRSNFLSRVAGRTFTVQPFSRRFTVTVPENCAELALDRIWVRIGYRQDVQESLFFRRSGDASWTAAMEDKISVAPGEVVELKLQHAQILDHRTLPAPAFRAWPIARRVLSECRDRARPWYERRRERTKKSHPIAVGMTGKK